MAQHVHLINAVRAGDHPATNAGTLHAALADPHRTGVNRSANLRRCANDTTGVNHHTTLGSGRRKQQAHPTAYEKLSFNGCSFARMNVALDKPHSPRSKEHSSVTTRYRNKLRRGSRLSQQAIFDLSVALWAHKFTV